MVARSRRNTECRNWRNNRGECRANHRSGRGLHRGLFGRVVTSGRTSLGSLAALAALSGAFATGLSSAAYANTTTSSQPTVTFNDALFAYNSGDKITALSHAKIAARVGSADAAVMAGYILRNGEAGTINLTDAKFWYVQAANQNHPDALVALGEMAIKNEAGLTQSDAISYLTRASDMGRTDAMRALSDLYRTGQGTVPNVKKSETLLKKASDSFDRDATKRLGDSYFEKDPKKALKYYEDAADAGHIEAAYIAGVMYAENYEIRPNSTKSASLLKQAAEGGHAAAQADYGLLVYQGYGATRSDTEAAKWFEKSAKGGDKEGQFLYAFTLAKGEGVTQSYEEAYYWLLKSDQSGNDDYDKDRAELKKRLEANVDGAVLARARARVK